VEERAVVLREIPLACGALELTPGAATGMTVGAEIAQPEPAAIATARVGAEVLRGVHRAGTAMGWGPRLGWRRRRRLGRRGVSLNATGCSTLYDGQGAIASALHDKLPLPGGSVPATACQHADPQHPPTPTPATPTGLVWNPTTTFLVPNTTSPATFIFDTEDGTIAAWAGGLTPPDQAVLAVDNSPGAVYKGLAFGTNVHGVLLFATHCRAGTIDVFAPNGSAGFRPATPEEIDGSLTDPTMPAGFAPFGLQHMNGDLFVTYARQDAAKHDDGAGPGQGCVDIFDTDGHLLRRCASRGALNAPWGVARASFAFGRFSGAILVGNFGNGKIHAFDSDGHFLGTLKDSKGNPVVIDGLWTLTLGGGRNSSSDTLYFTAGPNDETDGLFGTITPASTDE
jgi:uncharacterized protein (TIGR03118 family)